MSDEWTEVKKKQKQKQRFHALNEISETRALELEKTYKIRNLSETLLGDKVQELLKSGYTFYTAFRDTPEDIERFKKKCIVPLEKTEKVIVDNEWNDIVIFVPDSQFSSSNNT